MFTLKSRAKIVAEEKTGAYLGKYLPGYKMKIKLRCWWA